MDVTTETFQAFLDDAWDAAPQQANTLRDQLRTFEKQVTALFRLGSIGSVSKNAASQSYRGPGIGQYTPAQIQTVWRGLINLFDEVKACIDAELAEQPETPPDPNPPTNDADPTVYAGMKCRLQVVTEYSSDLTNLRLQPTLLPAPGGGVLTW